MFVHHHIVGLRKVTLSGHGRPLGLINNAFGIIFKTNTSAAMSYIAIMAEACTDVVKVSQPKHDGQASPFNRTKAEEHQQRVIHIYDDC